MEEVMPKIVDNPDLFNDIMMDEDVRSLYDNYLTITSSLASLQSEQRLSMKQQDYHNECKVFQHINLIIVVAKNNDYNYYFGYFESLVIVALGAFQVFYIMRLLEKRVLL